MGLLEKIFGNYSDKEIKKIMPIIKKINDLEPSISPLTDEELKAKTPEFKERLANGETLDDLLPEAFAVVREAAMKVDAIYSRTRGRKEEAVDSTAPAQDTEQENTQSPEAKKTDNSGKAKSEPAGGVTKSFQSGCFVWFKRGELKRRVS